MNKIASVAVVVVANIVLYLVLIATMPIISDAASTANTTMAATSNMSNYPGVGAGVLATPWLLFFVPGVIGIALIIIILKKG